MRAYSFTRFAVPFMFAAVFHGVTNAALASQLNSFGALGLTMQHVQKLQEWSKEKVVPWLEQVQDCEKFNSSV